MMATGGHRPTVDGVPVDGGRAVVWKHEIPVDDQVHEVELAGDAQVVHVAPHPYLVDVVWLWEIHTAAPVHRPKVRRLQVFGTGHEIPVPCVHLGTAVTGIGLVWHLVELR